jgi:hypothetical protein
MVPTDISCTDTLLHIKVLEGHFEMKISLNMLTVQLLLTETESAAPVEAGYLAFPPLSTAFLLA